MSRTGKTISIHCIVCTTQHTDHEHVVGSRARAHTYTHTHTHAHTHTHTYRSWTRGWLAHTHTHTQTHTHIPIMNTWLACTHTHTHTHTNTHTHTHTHAHTHKHTNTQTHTYQSWTRGWLAREWGQLLHVAVTRETPARHNTCVQPLLGNRNTCKTQHVRSAFDWKQKHLEDTTRAFGLGLEGLRVPLCIRIKKVWRSICCSIDGILARNFWTRVCIQQWNQKFACHNYNICRFTTLALPGLWVTNNVIRTAMT